MVTRPADRLAAPCSLGIGEIDAGWPAAVRDRPPNPNAALEQAYRRNRRDVRLRRLAERGPGQRQLERSSNWNAGRTGTRRTGTRRTGTRPNWNTGRTGTRRTGTASNWQPGRTGTRRTGTTRTGAPQRTEAARESSGDRRSDHRRVRHSPREQLPRLAADPLLTRCRDRRACRGRGSAVAAARRRGLARAAAVYLLVVVAAAADPSRCLLRSGRYRTADWLLFVVLTTLRRWRRSCFAGARRRRSSRYYTTTRLLRRRRGAPAPAAAASR